MAAHAAALACFVVAAAGAPAPPKLYVCQDRQCVQSASGLPLSECEAACAPPPNANYTCSGGQCVVSARGLPKALCTQVCGGPGPAPPPAGKTIVDLAAATPDLSTLVVALKAGGLVGTLSGQGPFTVFAPTNEAFAALPAGTVTKLLKPENKVQLDDILTYHVVAGDIHAKDLKDQETVTTLEGKDLIVRVDGDGTVFINSAKVITADVNASNGVVHIIDRVLIPAGPAPPPGPKPSPPGPPSPPAPGGGNHCWFRGVSCTEFANDLCRCGEIDAASRMPAAIFEPQNAVALQRYINITVEFYSYTLNGENVGPGPLEVGRCSDIGYKDFAAKENGPWVAGKDLMGPICLQQCKCTYGRTCKDRPDEPDAGFFCSLCGPKYNQPIDITLFNGDCRTKDKAVCVAEEPYECVQGQCRHSPNGEYTKSGCDTRCK